MNFLAHTLYLTQRFMRALVRQPFYIMFTLVQPILSLILYGSLFQRVVDIPGFEARSYISFVAPGMVAMTAMFSGGWNGMGMIRDLNGGVMDRFLVSPVSRSALIAGRLFSLAVVAVIQTAIMLSLAYLLGARFAGGLIGLLVVVLSSILLSAAFGALSNAMALTVRKEESVIGAANFILLPLTFLSPVFMASNLMPGWMRTAAIVNPVNWSVEASRAALTHQFDWRFIGLRMGLLLALTIASSFLATLAFRAYQKSV